VVFLTAPAQRESGRGGIGDPVLMDLARELFLWGAKMSVTNRLVFWWESQPGDNADLIERVMRLFESETAWCCRERVLPSTPIRMEDGRPVVDELEAERSEEPGIGFTYHFGATKRHVLEIAKRSRLIDVSFASGQRGEALFAEQRALPAERFNNAFSTNPTLSLGPHDIWEWSMEAGNPPPVLYYGRAAVSLSLCGYGSPDMHPPEFCELLVNLPEMKKLRAELDAIFGESRAVYMVNS
jgi:hypothetical protein